MRIGRGLRRALVAVSGAALLTMVMVGLLMWQPLWVFDQVVRWHLWRQHVQSRYVTVDGHKVHYFEALPARHAAGDGGAQPEIPLVLVHGLGARGEDWSALIPTLAAQGFHVYVPDLLGYGRTEKPHVEYAISTQEKLVADFMGAVGLQRADVAGWSMGGWVAMKLAADRPELVDRLVLLDAVGLYFPPRFPSTLFTPTDEAGLARLMGMLTPHPQSLPKFVTRAALRRLRDNAWVINGSVNAMEAGRDLMDFRLSEVRQPTLIVWGKQDALIPIEVGHAMHEKIAGSSMLVVNGCGHLAPAECSRPVLKGMVEFLRAEPAVAGVEMEVGRQ